MAIGFSRLAGWIREIDALRVDASQCMPGVIIAIIKVNVQSMSTQSLHDHGSRLAQAQKWKVWRSEIPYSSEDLKVSTKTPISCSGQRRRKSEHLSSPNERFAV